MKKYIETFLSDGTAAYIIDIQPFLIEENSSFVNEVIYTFDKNIAEEETEEAAIHGEEHIDGVAPGCFDLIAENIEEIMEDMELENIKIKNIEKDK